MKLLALLSLLIVASCGVGLRDPEVPIEVKATPISRPNLILPNVDRVATREVDWAIITPDNVDEIFAEMEKQGKAVVLFAITEDGYENLALNTSNILRVILQQQAVIAGYRTYYLTADGNIVEYNQSLTE